MCVSILYLCFSFWRTLLLFFSLLVCIDILSKWMTPVIAKLWVQLCSFSGDVMKTFFNFILSGTLLQCLLTALTHLNGNWEEGPCVEIWIPSWMVDGDWSSACRQDSTWRVKYWFFTQTLDSKSKSLSPPCPGCTSLGMQ